MKRTISRNERRIRLKLPLSLRGTIAGVYQVPLSRIVLENFIASCDLLVVIHSHITSVKSSLFTCKLPFIDCSFQGKRCDCKSLHWKFSDKATCDGMISSLIWGALFTRSIKIVGTLQCTMYVDWRLSLRHSLNLIVVDLLLEQWDPYSDPERGHARLWRNCFQET